MALSGVLSHGEEQLTQHLSVLMSEEWAEHIPAILTCQNNKAEETEPTQASKAMGDLVLTPG